MTLSLVALFVFFPSWSNVAAQMPREASFKRGSRGVLLRSALTQEDSDSEHATDRPYVAASDPNDDWKPVLCLTYSEIECECKERLSCTDSPPCPVGMVAFEKQPLNSPQCHQNGVGKVV